MYKNFTTEKFIFWHLLLEEYGANINYIKGNDNYAVDYFGSLPLIKYYITCSEITSKTLSESYIVNKLDSNIFPPTLKMMDKYQHKYKELVDKLKMHKVLF